MNVYEILDGEVDSVRELKLKTKVDFALGLEYYRLAQLVSACGAQQRLNLTRHC